MLHRQHRGIPPVAIAPKTTNRGGRVHPFTNEQNRRLRAVRSAAAVALFLARRDRRRNGWVGEPVVEGRSKTVRTAVEELFDTYLLGEDAGRIEDHWQTMYRGGFYRGGPVLMSAIAGVDQALWGHQGEAARCPRVRATRRRGARADPSVPVDRRRSPVRRGPNRRENRSRRGLRR